MWAIGKYEKVTQRPAKTSHVENLTRSAMAPLIRATVMTAKVSWKPDERELGDVAVALVAEGVDDRRRSCRSRPNFSKGLAMIPAMFSLPKDME